MGDEFNGFGGGWDWGIMEKGGEKGTFVFIGSFFNAIIGTVGCLPTAGERRIEIYLCVDAGGGRR